MKASASKVMIARYKNRFINFNEQKESDPNYVVYAWVAWIHQQWELGLITLKEYRSLLGKDILSA